MEVMKISRAQIKIHLFFAIFETTNQLFFQKLICLHFFSRILYIFKRRSLSKYKFGEIPREQLKVQNFATEWVPFCPNHINSSMKKYRRVVSHGTEERFKVGRKTDYLFQK